MNWDSWTRARNGAIQRLRRGVHRIRARRLVVYIVVAATACTSTSGDPDPALPLDATSEEAALQVPAEEWGPISDALWLTSSYDPANVDPPPMWRGVINTDGIWTLTAYDGADDEFPTWETVGTSVALALPTGDWPAGQAPAGAYPELTGDVFPVISNANPRERLILSAVASAVRLLQAELTGINRSDYPHLDATIGKEPPCCPYIEIRGASVVFAETGAEASVIVEYWGPVEGGGDELGSAGYLMMAIDNAWVEQAELP